MVSFGMFAALAAVIAVRSCGLASGSGKPERAATVNSRISLVKTFPRLASWAPLRYMMFLNCECGRRQGVSVPHLECWRTFVLVNDAEKQQKAGLQASMLATSLSGYGR